MGGNSQKTPERGEGSKGWCSGGAGGDSGSHKPEGGISEFMESWVEFSEGCCLGSGQSKF